MSKKKKIILSILAGIVVILCVGVWTYFPLISLLFQIPNNAKELTSEGLYESAKEMIDNKKDMLEDPEVVETLNSLSQDLDQANSSIESEEEKKVIALVRQSIDEAVNGNDEYKQSIDEAADLYQSMPSEEQEELRKNILKSVSMKELAELSKKINE
ncbi:MAG: hypothetical protein ACOWWR_04710 [Eubacteriales bacterium]